MRTIKFILKILIIVQVLGVSVFATDYSGIITEYKGREIKSPGYYFKIQYGYSGSEKAIEKWGKDNSYFLSLNLKDYSEEYRFKEYLLNYKVEGEIRKMLSFMENKQIDNIDDVFEDNMLRVLNILHKTENGYLPNEEQFIDYFVQKKPEILKYLYLETLRNSRIHEYPIKKESGNVWKGDIGKEAFYILGKEPYDLYLENRTYSDYYYDYKPYFIFGFLIFVGIFLVLLFKIFHKIHHRKKLGEKSDTKLEDSNKIDPWSEVSRGDKLVLYILALIIPPLLILLLSIPFFEEPIVIKNPWIDSVLFYGLIKLYLTRKYNHTITVGLIIILVWHVLINILIINQL